MFYLNAVEATPSASACHQGNGVPQCRLFLVVTIEHVHLFDYLHIPNMEGAFSHMKYP